MNLDLRCPRRRAAHRFAALAATTIDSEMTTRYADERKNVNMDPACHEIAALSSIDELWLLRGCHFLTVGHPTGRFPFSGRQLLQVKGSTTAAEGAQRGDGTSR